MTQRSKLTVLSKEELQESTTALQSNRRLKQAKSGEGGGDWRGPLEQQERWAWPGQHHFQQSNHALQWPGNDEPCWAEE